MRITENFQAAILDGSFTGEIYAVYKTTHFSWKNVDYPYIGPWTLSRFTDLTKRNNDCLFKALNLAKAIALSDKGRAAFAKVNKPGVDLGKELADGKGPEVISNDLTDLDANGVYRGDSGGSETQFEMDNSLWDKCGEGATEEQKTATVMWMAVTILHETAHWKDDVKKFPDAGDVTPP